MRSGLSEAAQRSSNASRRLALHADCPVSSPPIKFPSDSSQSQTRGEKAPERASSYKEELESDLGTLHLGFQLCLARLSVVVLSSAHIGSVAFADQVLFDEDLSHYRTKDGCYVWRPSEHQADHPGPTTAAAQGVTSVTPVAMIVDALDILLDRLANKISMDHVQSIGVCAESDWPVYLSGRAEKVLHDLRPTVGLHVQLTVPDFFSAPFISNINDSSTLDEMRMIEAALEAKMKGAMMNGSTLISAPSAMPSSEFGVHSNLFGTEVAKAMNRKRCQAIRQAAAQKNGAAPSFSGWACQLAKLRNGKGVGMEGRSAAILDIKKVWSNTGRMITAGSLICAVLTNKMPSFNHTEAAMTGLYDPEAREWDQQMLDICSSGEGQVLRQKLGDIAHLDACATPAGSWLCQKYGVQQSCVIGPSLPSSVVAYMGMLPGPRDGGISLSVHDTMIIPLRSKVKAPGHSLLPNPLHELSSQSTDVVDTRAQPWLALSRWQDAGLARKIVKDVYCSGLWSAFGKLVNAVGVGGSHALDNKLFTVSGGQVSALNLDLQRRKIVC
ncbi:Sugar (pentulose and hexulose) kinases [Ceraceosorus bombacis]|uniref:Sugar (Pentulose and hexulose) kinases n=1 Tax=Ceraceosorus bombacis TaxID=401625 RepID=A0A0P1BP94_9BASI|nr:Sugar (pentulose and hexulose) kinases [Ceraceosorus bombacis]